MYFISVDAESKPRTPPPDNLTVETIEPPTSVRVTDSDVESLKENWGWRKEKRDRGAIYRWALDHLEDIAIELLRYSSGSRSGYKTLSGKHYVANNGDR